MTIYAKLQKKNLSGSRKNMAVFLHVKNMECVNVALFQKINYCFAPRSNRIFYGK